MKNILQLNSSLFGESAQSTALAQRVVATLAGEHSVSGGRGVVLTVRDLAAKPLPHLTEERFAAFTVPVAQRTAKQARVVAESDALIEELRRADVVVLGLPMYNFGIPSTLKAYFDHVARAGVTFKYIESGPVGLLTGKKAYVTATRGGRYAGTPLDLQSAYVRQFLGIEDVEFVYAEGLAHGAETRAAAIQDAGTRIEQLAAGTRTEQLAA
jgi:FMN-dependent NADH-azoreductase